MTDRATLAALIARVEAATGADRELDAEIARALGWEQRQRGAWRAPGGHWGTLLPFYTASLDAAASLVPEGWQWAAGWERPANGRAWADAQPNHAGVTPRRAATPALALCAAALRAHMEMLDD